MATTLKLEFGDQLSTDELLELTHAALQEDKALERLIFEATRDFVARRRAALMMPATTEGGLE